MKIAAFKLKADSDRTRVGLVDIQKQSIQEYALQDNLSEEGVLKILKLQLADKPLPEIAATYDLAEIKLLAPIPRPRRNIFCVGKNYFEHAKEFGTSGYDSSTSKPGDEIPQHPIIFTKPPESVIGTGENIVIPQKVSKDIDYEVELTVIIGKGGKGITKADALKHVWAYTIINDVTARDWQQRHKQWFLGKSFDTFCPMGPLIVTRDELKDDDMTVKCWVNGELRQISSTSQMIWSVAELVHFFSVNMTLKPGMVIITGTPSGTAWSSDEELGGKWSGTDGMVKAKGYLKEGDTIVCEIEGIGILSNPIKL
jgi:2-keto-4-pentenoate hydratase/2-oxohepta-3-ene-1,7-dioic acid hydratase in catechol pathway